MPRSLKGNVGVIGGACLHSLSSLQQMRQMMDTQPPLVLLEPIPILLLAAFAIQPALV